MPVITLHEGRFSRFVGRRLLAKEMARWLPYLGLDIDEVGPDYVRVEFNPNRMDFSSHAGIARAFSGLRNWAVGLPSYRVVSGPVRVEVDPSVDEVRPHLAGAVVRNLSLSDEDVRELMEVQEDLHWGIGRNRRKASMGIHDLERATPPFVYRAVPPRDAKIVPLGTREEVSLIEVLERHEKGKAFGHLLAKARRYPAISDAKGRVISFPPVINSALTKVDQSTHDVFVEVTGTELAATQRVLNIFVTMLADMGGTIESVGIVHRDRRLNTPNLQPRVVRLRASYARQLSGLSFPDRELIDSLRRCRLGARKVGEDLIEVEVPAFRVDVLHEVDLVEEALIGYGYYRLKPSTPPTVTTGRAHSISEFRDALRQIMVGMGFVEVVNSLLSNEDYQYRMLRLRPGKPFKLANPKSAEYTTVRERLLPGLLGVLSRNKHESYPQRLFEATDVIRPSPEEETRGRRRLHIAFVSSHPRSNFAEARSYAEALLANIGVRSWDVRRSRHPSFIRGRAAAVYLGSRRIGVLGELHPEVLNNFGLESPTCAFEADAEWVMAKVGWR